jgi:hypothetical protein
MKEVGSAAHTLAALYRVTKDQTFCRVDGIAREAVLPKATCEKHLQKLCSRTWLKNLGREQLPGKPPRYRRTNTYSLTVKAKQHKQPFAMLPRWACIELDRWSLRAVFALVVSRHKLIEGIETGGCADGRNEYSLRRLCADCGLAPGSAIKAKRELARHGLIIIEPGDCTYSLGDSMLLNPEYTLPLSLVEHHWLSRPNDDQDSTPDTQCRNSEDPTQILVSTQSKNGGHPRPEMALGRSKNGGSPYPETTVSNPLLSSNLSSPKHISENSTAGAAADAVVFFGHEGENTRPRKRLRNVRSSDLADARRLDELHRRAVQDGVIGAGEHLKVQFFTAAVQARSGKDPVALFCWIVNEGRWDFLTCRSEDEASTMLRTLRPPPSSLAQDVLNRIETPDEEERRRMLFAQLEATEGE